MIKYLALPLLLVFSPLTLSAQDNDNTSTTEQAAQQITPNGFIVDNLYLFLHSGPGKNYRILGSVEAGASIQITNEQENNFVRIIDNKNRSGWVESKFVTAEAGLRQQVIDLNTSLASAQQQLDSLEESVPSLQNDYALLETQNIELQNTIKDLNAQLQQQIESNQNKVEQEQHKLLSYGGGIALSGLILGVILTLFLSRRKRYDGWS
ncbi:TIGR04211 family SH3 domain-containing protein [Pseudoalteromonas luteoviolacea]|uniref:TIGR04211 family SH3 domain-containing protein n=1 Tax=Pseudoalteromonas luteoviolacea TaxID=43657 RepID=UPI001F3519BD|nr:TIGR04211 family SH3 domain-containing protein [Pseudoalteromonas luteoviolacea]MCF6440222.1 TIGR04211 family SH3 domain-containing protein [Pseudoalteromonas luteoviolacea]